MTKISVFGAGKAGTTIAFMLQSCDFCTDIILSDVEEIPPGFVKQEDIPLEAFLSTQ